MTDLDAQLHDYAQRWTEDFDVPQLVSPSTQRSQWLAPIAVAAAVLAIPITTIVVYRHQEQSGAGSSVPGLRTCGTAPVSNGPHKGSVTATLTAPATAKTGTTLHGIVSLSYHPTPSNFESGLPIQLIILRGQHIVGTYEGFVAGVGTEPGRLNGSTYPVDGLLRGCPSTPIDYAKPDANRASLPPGTYDLVAVMDDSAPSAQHPGVLVTARRSIQITN